MRDQQRVVWVADGLWTGTGEEHGGHDGRTRGEREVETRPSVPVGHWGGRVGAVGAIVRHDDGPCRAEEPCL